MKFFFLCAFIYLLIGNSYTSAQNFNGVEDLGCPTDHSIRLNVVVDVAIQAYVEYGTSSGSYPYTTSTISQTANTPTEFLIDGLSQNTLYYYRLVYSTDGGTNWTERGEHTFRTQRPSGSTYEFTITADSHINVGGLGTLSEWQTALTRIKNDNPDFNIDLGDTFPMDGVTTSAQADANYLYQRSADLMGRMSPSVPIFLVMGNHENEEGWNFDDTNPQPIFSINARKKYFPTPEPDAFYSGNTDATETRIDGDHLREDYYAWEWGDALFIVFDPFQYTMTNPYGAMAGEGSDDPASGDRWNWTLGQQQYNWLKQVLQNSNAKYKFMFAHHMLGGTENYVRGGAQPAPWFEWGGETVNSSNQNPVDEFSTKRPTFDEPIRQLMIDYGVTAFFHGHDHQYVYEKRDGMVYQEVPSPSMGTSSGFSVYPNEGDYGDYQIVKKLPNSGYLRVTISPTEATVEYVKTSDGSVAYTYTMEPAVDPDYFITASAGANGSISPSGSVGVVSGGNQSFTITPNGGYVINDVLVDGGSIGPQSNYNFPDVQADHTISASFTASEAVTGCNIDLDGSTEYLYATSGIPLLSDNSGNTWNKYEVRGTFNTTAAGDEFTIFSRTDGTSVGNNGYLLEVNASGYLVFYYYNNDGTAHYINSLSAVNDGSEHTFRAIINGAQANPLELYVDDVQTTDGSGQTFGLSYFSESQNFTIGKLSYTDGYFWNGLIGELDIYKNDALTNSYSWSGNSTTMLEDNVGTSDLTSVNVDVNDQICSGTTQFTITASAGANGSINPSGAVSVDQGNNQSFTITPDGGYQIADVLVDGGSIGVQSNYQFPNVQANHTIAASFSPSAPSTLTLDGSVSSNTVDANNSSISITHTTGTGANRLLLVGVSWNCGTTDQTISSVTFTPNGGSATGLTEVITQLGYDASNPRYSAIYRLLNPTSGQLGTVTVTFSGSVTNGIVAGAANFSGVDQTTPLGTPNGAGTDAQDAAPSVTLSGLTGNELVFDNVFMGASDNTQTLTLGSGQAQLWTGWISNTRSSASTEQATGSSVTMSWTAASTGRWAIAAVPINPAPSGTQYTITATAGANGSINPSGAVNVNQGSSQNFTITPNSGYQIADVLVDGGSIGVQSNYQFPNVQTNHTIEASFEVAVSGALTLDGSVSSNTVDANNSSISITHTTGTGTNRLMLVGVSWNCGTTIRTISSVTFTPNGGSATGLTEVITQLGYDSSNPRYSAIYRLLNPPSGQLGTVTVTFSGSVTNGIVAGVANFAGVDQTTPLGTPNGAGTDAQDAAPSVTLSGLTGNELVFDNVFMGASDNTQTLTLGSGQAQLWTGWISNTRASASTEQATGGSVTMSWTAASTGRWAIAAVPINPAFKTVPLNNIVLGRPTNNSISINLIAQASGQAYFEYGTQTGNYSEGQTSAVSVTSGDPVIIQINGLNSDTKYYYRLRFEGNGQSEFAAGQEHSFHTQREKGESFTFTIGADSHLGQTFSGNDPDRYEQATLNIASEDPDFHLDLGDTFIMDDVNNQTDVDNVYTTQRNYFGNYSNSSPVFLVMGNHEDEEGWNLDDSPFSKGVQNIIARKKYFLNPKPDGFYGGNGDLLPAIGGDQYREDYYSWEWGDCLFVVLDPFQYTMTKPYGTVQGSGEENPEDETVSGDQWNWTLGLEQYNWLKQTLENSDAKFKFVFSHHMVGGIINVSNSSAGPPTYVRGGAEGAPYFEWGGNNSNGTPGFSTNRSGWAEPIHQLFIDNGVSAYFHAHDHQFVYEKRDGIVYQLVPAMGMTGTGFDLYSSSPYVQSGGNLSNSGHLRVTVSGDEATVDYVRSAISGDGVTNGQVSYSYTIHPPSVNVNAKVFLEGAYTGSGTMTKGAALTIQSFDPYGQGETVGSVPSGVIDWVTLELRKESTPGVVAATRAAFLKSNGSIVDLDGTSPVKMYGVTDGNYYIVVKQRNHLGIMSHDAQALSSSTSTLYDFTLLQSQAYGTDPMADLGDGSFGMIGGDANGDGQVTTTDYDIWLPDARAAATGYKNTDMNLDGQATTTDYDLWLPNARAAKSSQVP